MHDVIYKILLLHGKQDTENYMKFAFQVIINGIKRISSCYNLKDTSSIIYNVYFNQNNKTDAKKKKRKKIRNENKLNKFNDASK